MDRMEYRAIYPYLTMELQLDRIGIMCYLYLTMEIHLGQDWHNVLFIYILQWKSNLGRIGIMCSTGMLCAAISCHRKYCSIVSHSKLASETAKSFQYVNTFYLETTH